MLKRLKERVEKAIVIGTAMVMWAVISIWMRDQDYPRRE